MTAKKARKRPQKPVKIGRPRKPRTIRNEPGIRQFSPRGRRGRPGYKELKFEELESIRLADFMGLNQRDAAAFMKVSQQTFSRVLRSGRKCLAEALIKGKIIKVQGGDFKLEKLA
jgi:predicted DNA-binding protein (UPF0251 family)